MQTSTYIVNRKFATRNQNHSYQSIKLISVSYIQNVGLLQMLK